MLLYSSGSGSSLLGCVDQDLFQTAKRVCGCVSVSADPQRDYTCCICMHVHVHVYVCISPLVSLSSMVDCGTD